MDWAWHAHQLRPLLVFFCFGPLYFLPALSGQPPLEPFSKTRQWKWLVWGGERGVKSKVTELMQLCSDFYTYLPFGKCLAKLSVFLPVCPRTMPGEACFCVFFSFSFFLFLIASAVVEMTQGCCNDRLPATSGCLRGMP